MCSESRTRLQFLNLQKFGRTAHLTTLSVTKLEERRGWRKLFLAFLDLRSASLLATSAYIGAVLLTVTMLLFTITSQDWWAFVVVSFLVLARAINVYVIRCRSRFVWAGAEEPGEKGDLLVLLSQDRWIRMQGLVDDLKAVTSGQWLQESTFIQNSLVAFATLLVYLDAALAGNAQQGSKLFLLVLLFGSVALLGVANECTEVLQMHGRAIKISSQSERYKRRLTMADELIRQTGRKRLGD